MASEDDHGGYGALAEIEPRCAGIGQLHGAILEWIPDRPIRSAQKIPVRAVEPSTPVAPAMGVEAVRIGPPGDGGGRRDRARWRIGHGSSDRRSKRRGHLDAARQHVRIHEKRPAADPSLLHPKDEVVSGRPGRALRGVDRTVQDEIDQTLYVWARIDRADRAPSLLRIVDPDPDDPGSDVEKVCALDR